MKYSVGEEQSLNAKLVILRSDFVLHLHSKSYSRQKRKWWIGWDQIAFFTYTVIHTLGKEENDELVKTKLELVDQCGIGPNQIGIGQCRTSTTYTNSLTKIHLSFT